MNQPPEKKKSAMVFWLGCLIVCFLVGLIAVGAGMFYMMRREARVDRTARVLPAGWRDTLRSRATVPADARALAPARTEPGNAADSLLQDDRNVFITLRRLERGFPLEHDDSVNIAAARTDTASDLLVRAARMTEFSIMERQLARGTRESVYGVQLPSVWPAASVGALDALMLRGEIRRRDGRLAQAETDARAIIGLGVMMAERGASWFAMSAGRGRIAAGARLLTQVAVQRRDTATAAASRRVEAWAGGQGSTVMFTVLSMPDTALALAADTTMPFPLRAHALVTGAIGSTAIDFGSTVKGPTDAVFRQVRGFMTSPDRDLARLAAAVDSALVKIDDIGAIGRMRTVFRRMER